MNIKIITKFSLDPSDPIGRKNLNLLLTSAGLRSQIEVVSLNNVKRQWELILFLERAEFWGEDLKFLRDDVSATNIHHKGKVVPADQLISFEQNPINNSTGDTDT